MLKAKNGIMGMAALTTTDFHNAMALSYKYPTDYFKESMYKYDRIKNEMSWYGYDTIEKLERERDEMRKKLAAKEPKAGEQWYDIDDLIGYVFTKLYVLRIKLSDKHWSDLENTIGIWYGPMLESIPMLPEAFSAIVDGIVEKAKKLK